MKGELTGISIDYQTHKPVITLTVDGDAERLEELMGKPLAVDMKPYRQRRSKDANALLWHCIGEICHVTHEDKMERYKAVLKAHGQFTHVIVKEAAVEAMKQSWRACEVLGPYEWKNDRGEVQKGVQMLCYYGSSTYSSKEFSDMLDGVIEDMKDLGLDAPTPGDLRRAIELWEKNSGK